MKYRAGRGAAEAGRFGKPQGYPRAAGAYIGLGVTQTFHAERNVIGRFPEKVDGKARRFKIFMPVFFGKGSAAVAACRQGTAGRRAEASAVPASPAASYVLEFRGGLFGGGNMPVQGYASRFVDKAVDGHTVAGRIFGECRRKRTTGQFSA